MPCVQPIRPCSPCLLFVSPAQIHAFRLGFAERPVAEGASLIAIDPAVYNVERPESTRGGDSLDDRSEPPPSSGRPPDPQSAHLEHGPVHWCARGPSGRRRAPP